MTGRYLISMVPSLDNGTPRAWEPEKRTAQRWHLFAETCRSLAADGLDYSVSFALAGNDPHVLITASGTARSRKPHARPKHGMGQRVKPAQCAVHAQEAAWFLRENRERRNANTTHWRTRAGRYTVLNEMAEEELRAELEYWHELELLSGQREHLKPGLTVETAYLDDEVAA